MLVCPPITAVTAGVPPWYGTFTIFMFSFFPCKRDPE